MNDIINTLMYYFEFPFVRYALIVGILISLCSSFLGVTLVMKRYSYIGDGLSHVAFGATAVATILNLTNQTLIVLPVTLITSILLLRRSQNTEIKGDSTIMMISVGSMAIAYLLLNLFPSSANVAGDVCATLFGSTSILTLTLSEVYLSVILSIIVIIWFIIFYNRIFAVTFDEDFTEVSGLNSSLYNTMIAVIISIIVVLGMNLVGSLLISALVIFPAISAMQIVNSFKAVVVCSVIIAVVCSSFGIILSILISTPVGSTIVTANIIVFIILYTIRVVKGV